MTQTSEKVKKKKSQPGDKNTLKKTKVEVNRGEKRRQKSRVNHK